MIQVKTPRACTSCGRAERYLRPESGYLCEACKPVVVKNKNVCWLEKPCSECEITKPLADYRRRGGRKDGREARCKACEPKRQRSRWKPSAAAREARKAYDRRRRRGVYKPWHKRIKEYVERAARSGKEYWPEGCIIHRAQPESPCGTLWRLNAQQAWTYWVREKAPNWWVRAYYRAQGKPWNNPRISAAQKWRMRYWLDDEFRAKEIEKVQRLKERRAARIAATDDGTLNGAVIVGLFAAATHCHYCTKVMRSVEKTLDHVKPLIKGGAHSIKNVVVACRTCNTRKGRSEQFERVLAAETLANGSPSVVRGDLRGAQATRR